MATWFFRYYRYGGMGFMGPWVRLNGFYGILAVVT